MHFCITACEIKAQAEHIVYIIVIYLIPSVLLLFENVLYALPHVIWVYYSLAGGSQFIFYDRNGFGSYELIHSSYYKELRNQNWEELIAR